MGHMVDGEHEALWENIFWGMGQGRGEGVRGLGRPK